MASDTFSDKNGDSLPTLPDKWKWATLGEVSSHPQYGWTTKAVENGSLHILRTTDITSGHIEWSRVPFCLDEPPDKDKYLLKDGDVVISRAGSVGFSHLVKSPPAAVFASYLIRFRPAINERYFSYFLKSPEYWKAISENSAGIALQNVNASKLRQISIPVAPLGEQSRIIARIEELLTQLDAGVAALEKVRAQLRRYREAVLKVAFDGRLTWEWRKQHNNEIESASVLFDPDRPKSRIYPNSIPEGNYDLPFPVPFKVPDEWMWTQLGSVIESMKNGIYKPRNFYSDDGIACLRMYNIENGKIVWKDIKRMILSNDELEAYRLDAGDILVNRVNSRELVGKAGIIPEKIERSIYESKNIRLKVIEGLVKSEIVNYWFLYYGKKYFNRNAQQTVGMASINQDQISSMPFPFIPISEQSLLIEAIDRKFSQIAHLEYSIQMSLKQAGSLRRSILKRAFEGKLVPQYPQDESGAVLLKRIQAEMANQDPETNREKKVKTTSQRRLIPNGE